MPDSRFALRSAVLLANLRASPRCLLADRRGCFTEGKYGASSRSSPTTTTEHAPLEQLAELTDELRRITRCYAGAVSGPALCALLLPSMMSAEAAALARARKAATTMATRNPDTNDSATACLTSAA